MSKGVNDVGKVLSLIFATDRLSNPNDRPRSSILAPARDSPLYIFALFSQRRVSAFVPHIAGLDVTLRN